MYDVWLLRYEAWQTEFFVIWDHFLPFYPLTTQEIKILKKMKKLPWDIITLHTCTTNDNHMMYGSWNIERDKQIFFVFSNHFLPFYPPNNPPKNQNVEKKQKTKTPGDIIILHKCNINDNHMMYGYWDIKRDRQNFLSFGTIFCLFTHLTTPKIKILKNWKKTPGDTIILHKCTKNHDHKLYCSLDMARNGFNCYFSFWAIFYPFTSLTAQKIKI